MKTLLLVLGGVPMKRIALVLLLVLLLVIPAGAQNLNVQRVQARVASATTTTLVGAVAGTSVEVYSVSICLEGAGVATNLTLQDTAGTNLVASSATYALPNPGACLVAPLRNRRYFNPTAAGTGLQLVTSAAGPVVVLVEYVK